MSSAPKTAKLITGDDLGMMQRVLTKAGYTANMLAEPGNVAAMLMIRLFQEGTKDPAVFTSELERHFGKAGREIGMVQKPLHRFAIQGRRPKMERQTVSKLHSTVSEANIPFVAQSRFAGRFIEISVVLAILLACFSVAWVIAG